MRSLTQSTAYSLMIFMTDSADHIAGKTGLTLTISASKNGAAFAGIYPTVTERGDGWYSLALTTAHTDTLGDLAIRCTGVGADPTDLVSQVVAAAAAAPSAATVASAVRSELSTELSRIDVATGTRLASAGYTAPDNAGIASIEAQTNQLAFASGRVLSDIRAVKGQSLTGVGPSGAPFSVEPP